MSETAAETVQKRRDDPLWEAFKPACFACDVPKPHLGAGINLQMTQLGKRRSYWFCGGRCLRSFVLQVRLPGTEAEVIDHPRGD